MSALNDIQKGLYTKLSEDPILIGMITEVYDYVPDNQPFPQVVIGEFIENAWNCFGGNGKNIIATIHIYSDKKGNKEAFTILNRLNAILNDKTIPLEKNKLVSIQYEDALVWSAIPSESNSKEIREVVAKYRIYTQEI